MSMESPVNDGLLGPRLGLGHKHQCLSGHSCRSVRLAFMPHSAAGFTLNDPRTRGGAARACPHMGTREIDATKFSVARVVCSMPGPAWFEFSWMPGKGPKSRRSWARNEVQGARRRTTETSSKRSCGGVGPVCHGATCPKSSDGGRRYLTDSTAGRRRASGVGSSVRCRATAMMNGTASTAQSTALTSMPLAARGGSGAGHREVARRPVHEGPLGD
jgi:hypothetical protein